MKSYFNSKETACRCGCGMDISSDLLDKLNEARALAGIPFVITSGARCNAHNAAIEASSTSSHTKSLAADISAPTSSQRYTVLMALLDAGFARIGIHKDFIHCDIDQDKSDEVVWIY